MFDEAAKTGQAMGRESHTRSCIHTQVNASPTPSGQVSISGASNGPSSGLLGSDKKGDDASTPSLPLNDLDKENGDDGAHVRGTVMELLHSPRQSISPLEGIDSDQNIDPDSDRRGKNRKGSGSEVGESHKDKLNQVIDVSCRASATTF